MSERDEDERSDVRPEIRAALTPEAVRAGTRVRLLARAAADVRARGGNTIGGNPARAASLPDAKGGVSRRAFSLVGLALAASLVMMIKTRMDATDARAAFAAADQANARRIDSLQSLVASTQQLVSALTGPQVRVVGLSTTQARDPRAMMFWDKATDRWTFIAHRLAALKAGRTYQLWLVTADKKISAGTFGVTAAGDAFVQATFALDRDALKAVAVTEEPAGGVPVATGAVVLVGTLASQ